MDSRSVRAVIGAASSEFVVGFRFRISAVCGSLRYISVVCGFCGLLYEFDRFNLWVAPTHRMPAIKEHSTSDLSSTK